MQKTIVSIKAMSSMRIWFYRARHQNELYWRYVDNFKPWLMYQVSKQSLNDVRKALLRSLRRDGIAITTVEDLMGDRSLFEELENAVWTRESEMISRINKARKQADAPGFKTYLFELLGPRPVLDVKSIFVRFGLQPVVLSIANCYFGMFTQLRFFNVWQSFPSKSGPRDSQLWHRDPEDRYILKMFVYLTDVDEGVGPLTYAPGTHAHGSIKTLPEYFREEGKTARRSTDKQMSAVVPEERWITAIGSKGTVVFVDTRGYHKGGLARDRDRILYCCTFTSQASTIPEYFERKAPIPACSEKALAFALGA